MEYTGFRVSDFPKLGVPGYLQKGIDIGDI